MARILIAGCGYVGAAAAAHFQAAGWEVEGWTASPDSAQKLWEQSFTVRAVDVTDHGAVSAAAPDCDVVVHCVSSRGGEDHAYRRLYFKGAKNLLGAFPRATLLFTSSTSVYAQTNGTVVDENSPAEPRHAKGKILRETEDLILEAGGIVARLGGIHGPGRSFFLQRFLEGRMSGKENDRLINHVHRDDIVRALLLLAERRTECRGQIFNVVGDQPIKASEAHAWLNSQVKATTRPETADAGRLKRGETNKQVSNRKLRALGWVPRYPTFEVAMRDSILPSFGF